MYLWGVGVKVRVAEGRRHEQKKEQFLVFSFEFLVGREGTRYTMRDVGRSRMED